MFKRGRKYSLKTCIQYIEVWPSACRSKQLLHKSDHSRGSISELSLSYSLFYSGIGAEMVSDVDNQSRVVESYCFVPVRSNLPSSCASHNPNDHENEERLANDW